jgi:hypothetical protein
MAAFTIYGQISSKRDKAGVAALTIEAVSPRGKDIYGKTLTARDGTYAVTFDDAKHPGLFKTNRAITLQFRDRDEKVIHRSSRFLGLFLIGLQILLFYVLNMPSNNAKISWQEVRRVFIFTV